MKRTVDLRGKQRNIFRLMHFDKEGFIHMIAYRFLIVYSFYYGTIILLSIYYNLQLPILSKSLTVIMWILFTPQAYETIKGFSLISSGGLAYGHLSKEHVEIMANKYHKKAGIFEHVPSIAMLLWAIGFIVMVLFWQI